MVKLALLWHMHQPNYEDFATGEHILPWVRMHAIKDYWGMVAILEEFPRVHVTFNLVPSLVTQLQAFAGDRARDRHLELNLKPAAELSADEAAWVVANGFHAPYGRMIAPYPRFAELHAMRHDRRPFGEADLRDVQVWHKLAWMDPDLLARDPRLLALIHKGREFSEADKAVLRSVELDLLNRVLPAYRDAAARGQVELSTSPFYHPILPLLCDTDAHLRAHPGSARPHLRFRRPGDATAQIARAMSLHAAVFGQRPNGMWPSEGAVSDAAVALIAEAGIAWTATDEDILSRTLDIALPRDEYGHAQRPELLYRPYRIGVNGPITFFRDHALSDRIGFVYQSWDPEAAASDLIERVREAGRRFGQATGGEEATVAVILDGENAWEHYAGGGRPFLRALYGRLNAADDIAAVSMSEAAAGAGAMPMLPSIFPGSWINADFYIWIGHADDRRAWTQVAEARLAFDAHAGAVPAEARERAWEEILVAEGSDWFWWYGDDHSSDHDREFDDLFRRQLRNVYTALRLPIPDELYYSNITTGPGLDARLWLGGAIEPVLDGRETSDTEWVGAAHPAHRLASGAMHAVDTSAISEVLVGWGSAALHVRLAGNGLLAQIRNGATLVVLVTSPTPRTIVVGQDQMASDRLVEFSIPSASLGAVAGSDLVFAIQLRGRSGHPVETAPAAGLWTLAIPQLGE
ncbi:MAG: glycoside hydrolase family 57 protein [Vicinamibacterales bacterium]